MVFKMGFQRGEKKKKLFNQLPGCQMRPSHNLCDEFETTFCFHPSEGRDAGAAGVAVMVVITQRKEPLGEIIQDIHRQ